MSRSSLKRRVVKRSVLGISQLERLFTPRFEALEDRLMLDTGVGSTSPIVVGRTLSSYTVGGIQNNQETITYTVYNEQADPETGVLLTTTLESGVTFSSASQQPDQSGQNLAWSLGTIQGFDRASVSLTVSLASPTPTQLDTGAHGFATLDAGAVSASTPAATLRAGTVDPTLLASTPDANTTDPFIQEEAAKLSYDPQQIFNFLQNDIGYNSYAGSVRGARGTLWSSAGNALDVASLGVALMRASGIPAQYAQGTLSFSQAQTLILSMFPASSQTLGYIPSGTQTANPADDGQLLGDTENHFWFQFDTGGGMQDADPLIAGATVGKSFTTSTRTFAEVPDAMREKTEVQLSAEIYSQASALFGGSGLSTTVVLDHTFNDVDLVGHPLTFGNLVSTSALGGIVFSAVTNTYTPYMDVGDAAYPSSHDPQFIGDVYQETQTNFPLGNQILTGLFLNISLSGPQGPTDSYQRALVDRIGYAARQGQAPVNVTANPSGAPILSDFDVFTLDVQAGLNDPKPVPSYQEDVNSDLQIYNNPTFQALTPDQQAAEAQGASRVALIAASRDLANTFLSTSDVQTAQIAGRSLVTAYFARPRLILVSSRASSDANDPNGVPLSIDLRRDSMIALAYPGQDANAPLIFNAARGVNETVVEGNVLASYLGVSPDSIDDTNAVFDAAAAQNISQTLITPDDLSALDALSISAQAKARISAALALGNSVVVPTQSVTLNGISTVAWYEINPTTGEVVGVTEDGGHQGILAGISALGLAILGIGVGVVVSGEIAFVIDCVFQAAFTVYYPEVGRSIPDAQAQNDANAYFFKCVGEHNIQAGQFIVAMGKVLLDAIISFGLGVVKQLTPPPPPPPPPQHPKKTPHHKKSGSGKNHSIEDFLVQSLDVSAATDPIDYILDALSSNVLGFEPTATLLNTPQAPAVVPANQASANVSTQSSVAAGTVSGDLATQSFAVSGPVTASWASATTTSLTAQSLSAGAATVTDANGKVVGAGTVALSGGAGVVVSVSGNVNYAVSGQASLSFYPPATGNLGVSANWSSFNATLSGTDTFQLTTDALTLNGAPLPAGTYTVTTASATLGGSGLGPAANSPGAVTLQVNGGTLDLGPGTGSLSVGGASVDAGNGVSFTGFNGTATVTIGASTDSVMLNGNTTQVLSVAGNPATLATDQNTPASFDAVVKTSLSDTYSIVANAPSGWTVTVDSGGHLTVLPAPGLQAGTYPIQLIVQSASDPGLTAQAEVMVTVKPTVPAIGLAINPDPSILVPFNGAQLPTSFQAVIYNSGPAADTYNLTFSQPPAGFTILDSGTSVTVPAGQIGIVGVYLVPTGQIPAPGTKETFTVTATSTTTKTITQTQTETFSVPSVDAVTVTNNPTFVNTTPGVPVTDTLTLTNVGNVPENNISLTAALPSGLTASGLNQVSLAVGQSATVTITLTPDASVPLNTSLDPTVTATFGPSASPMTQSVDIPLQVAAPGVVAIQNASDAANQLGDFDLENRLSDLGTALTNLVQSPTSAVYQGQALANLDSLISQLTSDPFLSGFTAGLTTARGALAVATTANEVQTAVTNLGTALGTLATVITDDAASGFTLSLSPDRQVAQPGAPEVFDLVMTNNGSATTTYDLSVAGLPAGVTAAFSQSSVTIQPGGQITVGNNPLTLTLTETGTTLVPVGFTVTATAEGAAEITQSTPGQLTLRDEAIVVATVATNPAFTNAGGKVDVTAKVQSAVNQAQQVSASYTVTDPTGKVLFTSAPVPVALTVASTLNTVDLGMLDTTGFANGVDTITVTLADQSGKPIPGASATTTLLIGLPVTATLTTSPTTLATGTGTVTSTLTVTTQATFPDPLTLQGAVATPASGSSVTLYQSGGTTYAYESGTGGIDVLDVTDPTNPKFIEAFGQNDVTNGQFGLNVDKVVNGVLFVGSINGNNGPATTLLSYSLANPAAPTLISNTTINYRYLDDLLVNSTGTTAIVPTNGFFRFGSSVFQRFGDVISIDLTNPAMPTVGSALFNNEVQPQGGDAPELGGVLVNDGIAYITGSTPGGNDVTNETGSLLVVNTSDPKNLSLVKTLTFPGTDNLFSIAVHGNRALVTGYAGPQSAVFDPNATGVNGFLTLTVLDITDPNNPQILGQTLVTPEQYPTNEAGQTLGIDAVDLGNGDFAVSDTDANGKPALLVVDPSDPNNIIVGAAEVPSGIHGITVSGNLLYGTTSAGLSIYQIGQLVSSPVTVSVQVPSDANDTVVAGSITPPPSQTIMGTNSETLVWNRDFAAGNTTFTFTYQSKVSSLNAGEARTTATGATINFVSQGTPGSLSLPGTTVTGVPIISLTPSTLTEQPGGTATYDVRLENPTAAAVTYNLSVDGLDSATYSFPTNPVTVPAQGTVDVPMTLTSFAASMPGNQTFTVTAEYTQNSPDGTTVITDAKGTASGTLTIAGQPVIQPDTTARGVVVSLTPATASAGQGTSAHYVIQLTNVGSADDMFTLQLTSLPPGVTAQIGQNFQFSYDVPPGASNFRDIPLTLTAGLGTTPGNVPFTVTATSEAKSSVTGAASGTLAVVASGVSVSLSPSSGAPGSAFQETVTNTGTVTDTFNLALAGPAALVASLGMNQVTLAPGASQMVPINTGAVNFAVPGSLSLTAMATSQASPGVQAGDTAALTIPTTQGLTAQFQTPSQVLSAPGTATFVLLVNNTGNTDDNYTATIIGTNGPVAATLIGLDGLPTQSVPIFRLPGLTSGAIVLQASLAALGSGTVTVQVQSLSTTSEVASATATVSAQATAAPTATMTTAAAVPNPATAGQPITLVAVVTNAQLAQIQALQAAGEPTGTITFIVDGLVEPTPATLTFMYGKALARLAIPGLSAGTHQVQAAYSGDANFAPSVSPAVTLVVNPAPAADGPQVTDVLRYGYHLAPTTLVLNFNKPLDPARAENPANYRIVGPTGLHIPVKTAVYDPTTLAVTLHPSQRLDPHRHYVLTVNGQAPNGLTDTLGNLLDGNGRGKPGVNYVTVVSFSNLVLGAATPKQGHQLSPANWGRREAAYWVPSGSSVTEHVVKLASKPIRTAIHRTPRVKPTHHK